MSDHFDRQTEMLFLVRALRYRPKRLSLRIAGLDEYVWYIDQLFTKFTVHTSERPNVRVNERGKFLVYSIVIIGVLKRSTSC